MTKTKPSSSPEQNAAFISALAKVVSATPSRVRAAVAAAKEEPLSRHTKYTYCPAKSRD